MLRLVMLIIVSSCRASTAGVDAELVCVVIEWVCELVGAGRALLFAGKVPLARGRRACVRRGCRPGPSRPESSAVVGEGLLDGGCQMFQSRACQDLARVGSAGSGARCAACTELVRVGV